MRREGDLPAAVVPGGPLQVLPTLAHPWPLETLPGSLQLQGRTKSGFSSKAVGAARLHASLPRLLEQWLSTSSAKLGASLRLVLRSGPLRMSY